MATLFQYSQYSLLSFAAYANSLKTPLTSDMLVEAGFSESQATQFITDGWEVVSQSDDALYSDSGFSATLFKNTKTGEYVFANRGTAGLQDLFTDAWGITTLGVAGSQVIDMYRYYKQLITPAGQTVVYSADEIERLHELGKYYVPIPGGKFWSIDDVQSFVENDTGLGKISSNQTFAVTGHSLGGHLSLWLDALIPSNITHIYTYNGAGLGNLLLSAFTAIAGSITGDPITTVPDSSVTNIYAYGGPSIIAGVGGNVGANIPVNIEFKGAVASILGGLYNHSIVQLSDALAVANLYSTLDTSITTTTFNTLFDAASNTTGTSLEGMLDSLRKLFGKDITTLNNYRGQFYINLQDLQSDPDFIALSGKVNIQLSSGSFESTARTDFSAFLSLYNLSPVYLKANGISQNDLNARLGAVSSDIYSQWQSDNGLTAEQRAGGKAYFSDKYLHDRAAMLSWQIMANQADKDTLVTTVSPDDWVFIDAATNGRVTHRNLNSTAVAHQVYFGGSGSDGFSGGAMFADQYIGALKRRSAV